VREKTQINKADILQYDNVPVKIAAPYLGISDQAVKSGIQHGIFKFGVQNGGKGAGFIISPQKLIEHKEGALVEEAFRAKVRFILGLLERGIITEEDIFELIRRKTA